MRLLAVFDDSTAAITTMAKLGGTAYEVFSAEPLHPPEVPNRLLPAGVWGGTLGAAGGAGLAVFVFYIMNLRTGHMEMITLAPIGIILFGIAALCSIAGVLVMLLHEAGLLTHRLVLPAEVRDQLTGGAVALLVPAPGPGTEQILREGGARLIS